MAIFSRRLTVSVFLRDSLIFLAAYLFGAFYLPRPVFLELLNGMLAAVCAAVCIVFWPSIVDLWRKGATGVLLMRIAIAGAWADQMCQALARIYFIEFQPQVTGRTFDASLGLPAVGYIICAALHIVAIGMIDDNAMVRRNVCTVIWSLLAGLGGVGLLVFLHSM